MTPVEQWKIFKQCNGGMQAFFRPDTRSGTGTAARKGEKTFQDKAEKVRLGGEIFFFTPARSSQEVIAGFSQFQ